MRLSLRRLTLVGFLTTCLLALGTTQAHAQGCRVNYGGGGGYGQGYGGGGYGQGYDGGGYGQSYGGGGYGQSYGGGGYGQGYGGGGYGAGGGYGQSYALPTQQYYGNGGHDYQPHWHSTQTPAGSFAWYGTGAHDQQAHEHTNSPHGGYRGYSPSPFGGVTTSYYNSTPYTYMPW